MWVIAAQELMNMDLKKTPIEKCECMLRCNKIMNDVFHITSEKKGQGADDIFPLYIYILLKAQPQRFHSNINFMKNFTRENVMKSEAGYMITQLESAASWLIDLKSRFIKLSEVEL